MSLTSLLSPLIGRRGRDTRRVCRQHRKPAALWAALDAATAVEFALLAPILAFLFIGVIDFGMVYWRQIQIGNAARAGAEYAVVKGYNSSGMQSAANSATQLAGITVSAPAPFCGCPNASSGIQAHACSGTCPDSSTPGSYVTATTSTSYRTILPWPGISNPLTLGSNATVRIN